jgi:transcriptional regulator
MYVRPSHLPRTPADTIDVIRRNMFATMVTCSPSGAVATHLPFVLDEHRGEHGTLYAHMARANAQSGILDGTEALVIFLGVHAYISPSWYTDRETAPTWNYVAAHCYGRVRVHDEREARENIERLISVVEASSAKPWSMSELTEDDVRGLLRNVVSFEIPLARIEAKFKVNHGEKEERNREAIARLEAQGDAELAAYMRRYNDL